MDNTHDNNHPEQPFNPNNPLPEYQDSDCNHAHVIASHTLGTYDGYRVCLDCGARQYDIHHDQRTR